jgi:hypothetical protein
MPQVEMVRKGYLPFAKMRVEVAGQVYFLTGGKKQEIFLPEGTSTIKLRLEGWYKSSQLQITEHSRMIVIKPFVADIFYLVTIVLGAVFFYFDHLAFPFRILLGTVVLLHILTIFYFTILKSDRYFSCLVV